MLQGHFHDRRYTGLRSVHAPSASHNCSGVARNLSWARAARAAAVSPSASALISSTSPLQTVAITTASFS
jgi:hypothetical protein